METIADVWQHLSAPTPIPPRWLLTVAVLAGVLTVLARPIWPYARHGITITHEGGHALVGVLTGRRLAGITLHADTSGVTTTVGAGHGLGVTLTTFAGYPFPAVLAASLSWATVTGHVRLAFSIGAVLLLGMLLFTRNARGVLLMLAVVATTAAAAWWAPSIVLVTAAAALTGFWTAGTARSILEERTSRRHGGGTDAVSLATLTGIPAAAWWVAWLLVTLAAVYGTLRLSLSV